MHVGTSADVINLVSCEGKQVGCLGEVGSKYLLIGRQGNGNLLRGMLGGEREGGGGEERGRRGEERGRRGRSRRGGEGGVGGEEREEGGGVGGEEREEEEE